MAQRPRIPLPFGSGLDRDTGVMLHQGQTQEDLRQTQEDLRNVYLTDGMAFVRKGSVETADFGAFDRILAGHPFKIENAGIVVAMETSSGDVHVFRTDAGGTTPLDLGKWFTLDSSAVTPPRVFIAEVAGLIFMSHDEPAVQLRAPTIYYESESGSLYRVGASWAHATTVDGGPANTDIRFWGAAPIGSAVTVQYVNPGLPSQALSVTVAGFAVTVHLATNGGSALISTAAQVLAAIQASSAASDVVACALAAGQDGSGVVAANSAQTIDDAAGIRFRGVTEHLGAYLCGWAYGTESEGHPEYVRMSMPNDPTTFQLQHYEPIGQKGEPIRACHSTGRTLVCYKPFETWEHFGTDRSNFGIRQIDPLVGLLSTRIGVVVSGVCFGWSHVGPRVTDGSSLVDLSVPLALYAPAPADLPDQGDDDDAFACYLPDREQIRFHFGKRYYAYDVRTRRWSYGVMQYAPTCGFLLPGAGGEVSEAGYVDTMSITSDIETP